MTRQSHVPRNDMLKILLDIRQLIESEKLKGSYRLLNLFLNWCFHPNISESSVAYDFLFDLSNQCIGALRTTGSEQEDKKATRLFVEKTENILNIPLLRQELLGLFGQFSLPIFLFDIRSNWDALFKVIMEEICEKQLIFPEDVMSALSIGEIAGKHRKAFKTLQRIRQLDTCKPWAHIVGVQIIRNAEGFKGLYCLQLGTLAKVKYIMALRGKEQDSAFRTGFGNTGQRAKRSAIS